MRRIPIDTIYKTVIIRGKEYIVSHFKAMTKEKESECDCDLCVKKYGPRETVFALHAKRSKPRDYIEL